MTTEQVLAVCERAARAGGTVALALQQDLKASDVSAKGEDGRDIVTTADRESQRKILTFIRSIDSSTPFIGEEKKNTAEELQAESRWGCDPVDGTQNFSVGSSQWATTVFYMDQDGPVAGAIYLPAYNKMYTAGRNLPCLLNDQPLPLHIPKPLAQSIVGIELGDRWIDADREQRLSRVWRSFFGPHLTLSACVSITELLDGITAAYVNLNIPGKGASLWDFAAGVRCLMSRVGTENPDDVARTPSGESLKWDQEPMEAVLAYPDVLNHVIALLH